MSLFSVGSNRCKQGREGGREGGRMISRDQWEASRGPFSPNSTQLNSPYVLVRVKSTPITPSVCLMPSLPPLSRQHTHHPSYIRPLPPCMHFGRLPSHSRSMYFSPPSLLPQPPSLLFPHSSSPRRHPNSVLRLACSPSEESGRQRPRHPHRAQGGRVLSSWLLLNVCRRRGGGRDGRGQMSKGTARQSRHI